MQSDLPITDLERDLLGMREYPPVLQQLHLAWRFVRRWPVIPLIILSVLVLCGIFAPALATHGEAAGGIRDRHYPPIWMQDDRYDKLVEEGISPASCLWGAIKGDPETTRRVDVCNFHIFGTDHSGRDVYSRMLHGARISLWVAAIALLFGFVVGTTMGVVSGYAGGWIDEIITRLVDIWQALPFLMVALVCVLIFGQSTVLLLALMAALSWVPFVRVIRGQTLTIKNDAYVELARVAGCSTARVLIRHIVPGVINTAVVIATLIVGSLILAEAALSFLGAGVPAPDATWGSMVSEGRSYISTAWWPTVLPGLAIFMVVLSLNFTGDWLRDRLDPRLQQIG
ncbi:MAG: ABC transporter permease [Chloroflexi bacterium]|nr:ABC transporter permease [Chloroflexota bacterium]